MTVGTRTETTLRKLAVAYSAGGVNIRELRERLVALLEFVRVVEFAEVAFAKKTRSRLSCRR